MIQADVARLLDLGADFDKPMVAWNNYLANATAITSNRAVLTDGALANAVSGTTFDYWLPDVTASTVSYSAQFSSDKIVTFAGIAGHNLGTLGGTVRVQLSADGVSWTDSGAGAHTPTDDGPIGFRMIDDIANSEPYWRFYFEGLTAGDDLYVAVLFMGREEVFPVGIYDGFAPPIVPTEVQLQSNVSVGGNLLGSDVVAQGTRLTAEFRYMSPTFVRSTIDGFLSRFNSGDGFWFVWRPYTFDEDLRYCWRDGATAVPVNSGGLDYMSLTLQMRAYES